VTRLTRYARGLLVALAALALTGGAVLAARSLPSPAAAGTQYAATVSGQTIPAAQAAGTPDTNDKPDADETPEPTETPDADAEGTSNATVNPDRPQNHGWFVSQAANSDTPAGFANHGDYVSSIARGDAGKTGGSAQGTSHSADGKTEGAAAQDAHQH
jgi:hypothetical protein